MQVSYKTHFKDIFSENGRNLENLINAGDFNIKFLEIENIEIAKLSKSNVPL